MDWEEFALTTTAASTFATALSSLFLLWLRRRGRAEPDWAVHVLDRTRGTNSDPRSGANCHLTNAGDGPAFRVTAGMTNCGEGNCGVELWTLAGDESGWQRRLEFAALIAPGEHLLMIVRCMRVDWDRAQIVITWTASPTRLGKRRSARIPLREIAEQPAGGS